MKTDWYCQILPNLPPPPKWLTEKYCDLQRPASNHFQSHEGPYVGLRKREDWKQQSYDWIQPMASNDNVRRHFDSVCLDWIRQNIVSDFTEKNSGIMFFDQPQLPHTDSTRDFVLLYNVETGGEETELCFWQETGFPLFRARMTTASRGENLKKILTLNGPAGSWYLMNTLVLHSVENMTGLRINLQISFEKNIPLSLLKMQSKED